MTRELSEESWEQSAREGRIEDAIVEFIRERDCVTFAELQGALEPYMPTRGDVIWGDRGLNLLPWEEMSPELVALLERLCRAQRLFLHPAGLFAYADGTGLNRPVAWSLPRGGFGEPHWLPMCLRTVPLRRSH